MEEKKRKISFKVLSVILAVLLLISAIPLSQAAGGKVTVTNSFYFYKKNVTQPGTDHVFIWEWAGIPMFEISSRYYKLIEKQFFRRS